MKVFSFPERRVSERSLPMNATHNWDAFLTFSMEVDDLGTRRLNLRRSLDNVDPSHLLSQATPQRRSQRARMRHPLSSRLKWSIPRKDVSIHIVSLGKSWFQLPK